MAEVMGGISGLNMGLWLLFLLIHSAVSHAIPPCSEFSISCPVRKQLAPQLPSNGSLDPAPFAYIGQRTFNYNNSNLQSIYPGPNQQLNNFTKDMICIPGRQVPRFCPKGGKVVKNIHARDCGFVAGCRPSDSGTACPPGGCSITIRGRHGTKIYTHLYSQFSHIHHQRSIHHKKALITLPEGWTNPIFVIGYEIFYQSQHIPNIKDWRHGDCWWRKDFGHLSKPTVHGCISGPDPENSTQWALTTTDKSWPISSMTVNHASTDNRGPVLTMGVMHSGTSETPTNPLSSKGLGLSTESEAGIIAGGVVVALLLFLVIIVLIFFAKQGHLCTNPSTKSTYPNLDSSGKKEENVYGIDDSPAVDEEYDYEEALPVGTSNNFNLDNPTGGTILGHPTATSNNDPIPDSESVQSSVSPVVLYDNPDYESADDIPPPLPPRGS